MIISAMEAWSAVLYLSIGLGIAGFVTEKETEHMREKFAAWVFLWLPLTAIFLLLWSWRLSKCAGLGAWRIVKGLFGVRGKP